MNAKYFMIKQFELDRCEDITSNPNPEYNSPFFDGIVELLEAYHAHQSTSLPLSETEPLKEKPLVNERYADNGAHSHWELLDTEGEIIWTEDTENCFMDEHHPTHQHTPKTAESEWISVDLDELPILEKGDEIKLYGKLTTVEGFEAYYNDALEEYEIIILTTGRGDPFRRTLRNIEIPSPLTP